METTNKTLGNLKQGDTFFYFFADDNAPQMYKIKEIIVCDEETTLSYRGSKYTFGPDEVIFKTTENKIGESKLIAFHKEALEMETYESWTEDDSTDYVIGTNGKELKFLIERWDRGSDNDIVDMTK